LKFLAADAENLANLFDAAGHPQQSAQSEGVHLYASWRGVESAGSRKTRDARHWDVRFFEGTNIRSLRRHNADEPGPEVGMDLARGVTVETEASPRWAAAGFADREA
jgi:hypothetical protein